MIDGRIRVTVVRIDGEAVKIGIEAPASVPVHRQEIYEEIQRNNEQAVVKETVSLPKFSMREKTPPITSSTEAGTDRKDGGPGAK